jgi:hypothetical protein
MLARLMTTSPDWSEFEQLSELELWRAIADHVAAAADQRAFSATWLGDDTAEAAETDVERLDIGANMAILAALLRRFPESVQLEVDDEDADVPRIRLTVEFLGVRDPVGQLSNPASASPIVPDAEIAELRATEEQVQCLVDTAGNLRAAAVHMREIHNDAIAVKLESMADDDETLAERIADRIIAAER